MRAHIHTGSVGSSGCMGVRGAPLWLDWAVWEHKVAFSWFPTCLGGLTLGVGVCVWTGTDIHSSCKGEMSECVWLQRVARQPGQCPHMECHNSH